MMQTAGKSADEVEFFEREAAIAKSRFQSTLSRGRADLGKLADLRAWGYHCPFITVGIAVAVGFLGGRAIRDGNLGMPKRAAAAVGNSAAGVVKSFGGLLQLPLQMAFQSAVASAVALASRPDVKVVNADELPHE